MDLREPSTAEIPFKGFIEAGYGNLNQYQVEAGVSGPLVQDKLFYRLSGGYNSRDGYINNLALQSDDLLSRQASFGNLRLAYVPSNKFSITLNSSFENRDAVAYALVGGFGVDGATIDSLRENAPYQVSIDGQGDYETLSLNNALKLDYTTDKISFKSITSIQYNNLNRSGEDFDFTPFDLSLIGNQERTDLTIAEELRVNSVGNRKLNWLGGLFLYSVSTDNFTPIISGADNALFATNPEDAAIYPFTTVDEADQDQIGIAVFANIDYALTDKLKIIAGLRYEREEFDTDLRRFYIREGDEGFSYPNLGLIPDEFTAEATFEAVSPKFGLSYNLSDDILLWGNIARGYRPGGINPYTTNREQAVFDPESSWNYELGVKSNLFDNRIKLNLTGFYLNYDDQQLFTVVDITTFNFGRANLGRSESYGLELETEWIVSKGLRFIGNLAYLETEIVDFEIIGFSGEVDNRGNRQGFSPRWSGNAGLSYQDEFGPFKFNATIDYQYQTDVFFDPENALRQPAYGLLSARVSLGYQNYELSLWGDNITDEVYFSYGYGVGAAALFGSYGLPRTYGSNFTIRF